MGFINRVDNADYSQVAVGKYDFNSNIFRRKINNKLELNYLALTAGRAESDAVVDLSKDYYIIRAYVLFGNQGGGNNIFSVADYTKQRTINVTQNYFSPTLTIQFYYIDGTTAYSVDYAMPSAPDVYGSVEIEFSIDFANHKVGYIKINGTNVTVPNQASAANTGAWTGGQTRTICFGSVANLDNTSSRAFPYFGQITDNDGNIQIHFDFLGDNEVEILTDKARLIQLTKTSEVTIVSRPIEI